MNILSINNLKLVPRFSGEETQNQTTTPKFGLTMAKPLLKDTVSFGHAKTKLADIVEQNAIQDIPRLERLATTYLDVLESVANKLKDQGVSFDRAYCERNPVKSPKSFISKITRSGNFNVPDRIRATLFVKNPYDLSILNDHILPELKKRDFIIAKTEGNLDELIAKGYVPEIKELSGKPVIVPDLDIRLARETLQAEKLSPEYIYCIGKPQKSGYEDIQMRLIRGYDNRKNPVQHELIVLMGENYAYAKHLDSEMVYGVLRNFEELNIIKKGNEGIETFQAAKRYINLIRQLMSTEVSNKLFSNAKKLDTVGDKDLARIKIDEANIQLIEKCFEELEKSVATYYKTAKSSKRIAEATKKKLTLIAKEDKEMIEAIKEKTFATIEFFNKQNYLTRKKKFD